MGTAPRGGNSAGDSIAPGASPACWFPHELWEANDSLEGFTTGFLAPTSIEASGCLDARLYVATAA